MVGRGHPPDEAADLLMGPFDRRAATPTVELTACPGAGPLFRQPGFVFGSRTALTENVMRRG